MTTNITSNNNNNSSLTSIDVDGSSNQHSDHQLSESNDNNSNNSISSTNQQNNVLTSNEFDNVDTEIKSDIQETTEKNKHLEVEILKLKTELENSQQKTIEQKQTIIKQGAMIIELQDSKKKIEDVYTKFKQRLREKSSEVQSLIQRNSELENEASNYQSALGVATNINISDDDINHNVQLHDDVLSLQDKIDDYVTNLGKLNVNIKIDEIKKLLPRYGCQIKIDPYNVDKQFIKAILRRHVLETIFEFARDFFSNNEGDNYLESVVVKKTDELYGLMEKFSSTRGGTDEITKVTPIKLRQLIYTALGMRGLGDIKESDKSDNICVNNFITEKFSENLNKSMDQYRVITNPKKKESADRLSKILIQEVFRIFYFRLKIQEPIAQYHWFNCGDKVSKTSMDTNWDEDEIDELVVELCTFPLIYQVINSNQEVFTSAKVFTRRVPQPSPSLIQNVGSLFKGITGLLSNNSDNSDQAEQPNNDFTVQNTANATASDDSGEYETGQENDEEDIGTNTTNTVETPQ
ncbi:unnamed protein product [Rhizophagus irregularis]|nr:unnamed protein product [Rhizophagus irregularis]